MNKNILKSIAAVGGGFLVVAILSVGTDFILEATGFFPQESHLNEYTWWMYLIALIYRSLYTVLGGYLTARLAPNRPMRHVIILGVIGLVVEIIGTTVHWEKTTPGSEWYPILLLLLSFPCIWLGGKLRIKQITVKK